MPTNKQILKKLQSDDEYLFHGSPAGGITVLEPRQAYSHNKPDGNPGIGAAEDIDPAIFMAIIGGRGKGGWDSRRGGFGFYVDRVDLESAQKEPWIGYVYVLKKSDFHVYREWEWRSELEVKPVAVYEVEFTDLPEEIDII